MVTTCPVCRGTGKALEKYSREIHWGDGVYKSECWMCGGFGTVEEMPAANRIHLKKYWNIKETEDVNKV